MKQAQIKRLNDTHSNFKAEWLKDPDLKGQLQKDTANEDLVVMNVARSPSEMQTNQCYCDIIILTDTKVH